MQRVRGKGSSDGTATKVEGPKVEFDRLKEIDYVDPLLNRTIANRYNILRKIGGGGMGAVYLAFDQTEEKKIAFKVINEEYTRNPQMVERFVREAKACAQIIHPNTIEVFDLNYVGNKVYMTMEYLDGTDLAKALKSGEKHSIVPFGLERTKAVMMQICEAIAAAHELKIIHRDLKPPNIFLLKKDGRDFVKVLDFGLAKFLEQEETQLTQTGIFLGTASYASPEQATGKKDLIDERSDIYALGIIMFELLTGRVPFRGESPLETLQMHLQKTPPKPSGINPAITAEVEEVILRAIAKKPGERFQSAIEMRDAIASCRSGKLSAESTAASDELFLKERDIDDSAPDLDQMFLPTSGILESPGGQSDFSLQETNEIESVKPPELPKKKSSGAFRSLIKGGIAITVLGGIGAGVYQYRDNIQRTFTDLSNRATSPSSSPSGQYADPPVPSTTASTRREVGHTVDILVTPSGLDVFVPARPGHGGRWLGKTPLTNMSLYDYENELLIRTNRSVMTVRLVPGQRTINGPFRPDTVRTRPSLGNSSAGTTTTEDQTPEIPDNQE